MRMEWITCRKKPQGLDYLHGQDVSRRMWSGTGGCGYKISHTAVHEIKLSAKKFFNRHADRDPGPGVAQPPGKSFRGRSERGYVAFNQSNPHGAISLSH